MPRLQKPLAEGSWVEWTLETNEDTSDAVEVRVDYEYRNSEGAVVKGSLTVADGLTRINGKKPLSQFVVIQKGLKRGENSLWTYAKYADGWEDISPDPVVFTVTAPGRRP